MDQYIQLAKNAINEFVILNKILKVPNGLPDEMMNNKAGIFVSLHKKIDHSLRGCIGTFLPTKNNIAEEIIANSISASSKDPRFLPLTEKELNEIAINVDVLSAPEPVDSLSKLDPYKYGLLVKNAQGRSGLLLPDIGVEAAEDQFNICCKKGGIDPNSENIELYRFTVERHK